MKMKELHQARLEWLKPPNAAHQVVKCSCGWQSTAYYVIGPLHWINELRVEFIQHLLEESEVVNRKVRLETTSERLARSEEAGPPY